MLKKIFFPFCNNHEKLQKYWWHRFFVVIFFIALIAILFGIWIKLNQNDMTPYTSCVSLNVTFGKPANQGCEIPIIHSRDNFLIALISMVIFSYSIQLFYYKILLYIIFGNNSKSTSE